MNDFLDFVLNEVTPALLPGLKVSLALIIPSSFFGVLLGVVAGALRVYGGPAASRVTNVYVSLFRGTPLVVQLYFWYFALPYVQIGGVNLVLSPMTAAIMGFALCSGAYQSEYIRGGLLSIKRGQLKAALALGMTPFQAVREIVLPQAFRRALPGCGNEIIYLIKYSSLASIITVNDLTGLGRGIAKATFRNTEAYLTVGLYYLALVTLATLALRWAERKMSIPGFEYREE